MASSSAIASCIPDKPHQPRGVPFPKRDYGETNVAKRSFQPSWFDKWPWLHYCEENDCVHVVCHTCLLAKSEKKLLWSSNADTAFISRGFTNWKDATKKFPIHEATIYHKEACLKIIILPSNYTRYCFQPLLATPSRMGILLGVARTACLESLVAMTDVYYPLCDDIHIINYIHIINLHNGGYTLYRRRCTSP